MNELLVFNRFCLLPDVAQYAQYLFLQFDKEMRYAFRNELISENCWDASE